MPTLTWHDLPDYLLSRGTTSFTTAEAADLVGGSHAAVYQGLQRLVRKGEVFSPAQGFYVPIPPEYRSWGGSIPAHEFIDPMMRHLGRRYYVALMSAAEIHGAAHQRPQVLQVMVDQAVRNRDHGRARLRFYVNRHLDDIPTIQSRTRTGDITVSTPEATALDLVTRPRRSGGLDNIATILIELVEDEKLDPVRLAELAEHFPDATVHRIGWMLDTFTEGFDTAPLATKVRSSAVTALDPQAGRRGKVDPKWRLIENRQIEPDVTQGVASPASLVADPRLPVARQRSIGLDTTA
jgi:predicted transcriptional regulator of viral defense system